MSSENTFHGWAITAKDKPLEWIELPLKNFDQDSVDMKVSHCGVCGSDIHTQEEDWGKTDFPCVTGHEIVGECTRVGENVKHIKVGDRIGVGAQSGSCGECKECKRGDENICQGRCTYTYNSRYPNGDKSFGGYADKWRGHQRFVFKIPDNMTNEVAATFFCAGVTTYSPFKRYGVNASSKVGVIGIGGLGHFAVQWAKAMGAEVVALSSSDRKRDDAMELGCDSYVVTSKPEQVEPHKGTFTHILATHISEDFNWGMYFNLIDTNGYFIMVALPEAPLSGIPSMILASRQIALVGSMIGSPAMIEDMLNFAAEHDVKPWLNKYSMKDCNEAIQAFKDGKPRYRIILEN
ncbi:chaperonin 10-like protein [Mucor mucedo]|uniref:chaperonin 10-like protein n=1 Tax=Mucor mucedo TaxID=29922 RepID=UPI002220338D|nr:chaperonin 10-like protein [Mucor mucedo]KAI7864393.1 chaperonin 10-like protein [Mucor mucedo]